MPRGPGKKENYNLDYSRFNQFDHLDDSEQPKGTKGSTKKLQQNEADAAGGLPMDEIMQHCPPELKEAYRLMAIAHASGDADAQRRANELALGAVQRGGPQVKREFIANLSQHMPDLAARISTEYNNLGDKADPATVLDQITAEARDFEKFKANGDDANIQDRVGDLEKKMRKGAEATRQQLENLERHHKQLEQIQSPEDFFKFVQQGGMTEEDLQKCFSGDMQHMESCVQSMLDKAATPGPDGKLGDCEEAIKAVEALHTTICGDGSAEPQEVLEKVDTKNHLSSRAAPKHEEPEVTIPQYRLQYHRDEDGRYLSVELKCQLPGVADMSAITLDVSEKHLRLSTSAPAPLYVVNAGPFPVLIEAEAARAKYSKKREELSVTVPAKIVSSK